MRKRMMWVRGKRTGTVVTVPENHARFLRRTGHMVDAPLEVKAAVPEPVAEPRQKRTYRRRDMVAEPSGPGGISVDMTPISPVRVMTTQSNLLPGDEREPT